MEAVIPLDPRPDFRVGGTFGLQTRFALIAVDIDYESEYVAVHGHAGSQYGVRIPFVWWTRRDSNPRPLRCERSALPRGTVICDTNRG